MKYRVSFEYANWSDTFEAENPEDAALAFADQNQVVQGKLEVYCEKYGTTYTFKITTKRHAACVNVIK